MLTIFSLSAYFLSCYVLVYTAPYSPSLGTATPLYLLEGIDPTFFLAFQVSALVLLFDVPHQHTRDRIDEVLHSKPVTNFEYLAGRTLAIAFLLWLVVAINLLAMETIGVLSVSADFNFAEPIQLQSILNLLLFDAPATLLIWCSLVVFLSVVQRSRMFSIVIALTVMIASLFLVLSVPFSLLAAVSVSSNDSLFVSDLIPDWANWQTLVVRAAAVLGAFGLVAAAATLMQRRDSISAVFSTTVTIVALGMCVGAHALSISDLSRRFGQPEEWYEAHGSYPWNGLMDIHKISGNVRIEPGKQLAIDLDLSFSAASDAATNLVFTLNPAMKVSLVELDGIPTAYTFKNGLLELASEESNSVDFLHNLRVEAHGIPDPRFAYVDSAVDYLTATGVPRRSVRMLGKDSSIFRRKFVALMPGSFWYPVPGPILGDSFSQQPEKDYFDVDLLIDISDKEFDVVGTGNSPTDDDASGLYRLRSEIPVSEIGLFAADYERVSTEVSGVTFSAYLHKRHAKNLNLVEGMEKAVQYQAQEMYQTLADRGLTFPQKRIAFVEIPNRLRTVGGGWRMDTLSALPGVALMKSYGFPRTSFERKLDLYSRARPHATKSVAYAGLLAQYFAMGLGSDNLMSSLPEHLWSHATSATGKHSRVLDQIVLALISFETWTTGEFFSIYSTFHVANTTAVSPHTLSYGANPEGWSPSKFEVRESEVNFGKRQSLWNQLERKSEFQNEIDNQRDLEVMLLKCKLIADGLLTANDLENIFEWLADVRRRYAGKSYTYDDLLSAATRFDVVVEPFLTDWLRTSRLPGYVTKPLVVQRISDDEQGTKRYQTSLTVRNVESVTGFFVLEYSSELTAGSPYPYYSFRTDGVQIEGNSAKQINLITEYPLKHVRLRPFLSLNQKPFVVWATTDSVEQNLSAQPAQFEESIDWSLSLEGIVIDDLDPGFRVLQPQPSLKQSENIGPLDWFREHQLETELDNGIPSWQGSYPQMPKGVTKRLWNRSTNQRAYGHLRRTFATLWARDPLSIPVARFEANIPETTLWKLEYHLPAMRVHNTIDALHYQLEISDHKRNWQIDLDAGMDEYGWIQLGEFELQSGTVSVDLVGASNRGYLYADAIRWTKVPSGSD